MTTWTKQINAQVGVGTPFNKAGLLFNTLNKFFGGVYKAVWNTQSRGQ